MKTFPNMVKCFFYFPPILLFLISTQVFAFNTVKFTEDALLHDRRIIKVQINASNTVEISLPYGHLNIRKSGFDKYSVKFTHPDTQESIDWEGERGFSPLLVDIIAGTPYIVIKGRPDQDTKKIYGCPELPFIYLQYAYGEWKSLTVQEAPIQLVNSNLYVYQTQESSDGRNFPFSEMSGNLKFQASQTDNRLPAKIPRNYDDWSIKSKNDVRNGRQFGDCRPSPKLLTERLVTEPKDLELEIVTSTDYAGLSENEYNKLFRELHGEISADCSTLFKIANPENHMLGEVFVKDSTGTKQPPYAGPPPIPSGRILERRADRYCSKEFVWFIAPQEELGKTHITKYTVAGDFIYNIRMPNPVTANNNLYRGMIGYSIKVENNYFYFNWDQSLPTTEGPTPIYNKRITRFRFKEPVN